jgi:ArsR family transcriptional regulator, arsenate/arsenite/antimonite-responsive transcriptional repressor
MMSVIYFRRAGGGGFGRIAFTRTLHRSGLIRLREYREMPAAAKNRVDLTFRAFADPIRLRVLNLLQDGELCVCDLVEVLKLPQPTVSRHLSYLRRSRLVRVRQERSWNFYELAPARTTFHMKMLDCLLSCYPAVPEMARDRERSRQLRNRGGCCPT